MAGKESEMRSEEPETPLTAQNAIQNSTDCLGAGSRRAPLVVPQQPAQRFVADNILQREVVDRRSRRQGSVDWRVAETLVRPVTMVEIRPMGEDMPQMILAEDDEVIQDFCACAAHPTLGIGIQIWTSGWDGAELDAIGFKDRAELGSELRIPVAIADLGRIVQEAGVMAALANSHITDAILLEAFEKQRMGEASPCKNPEKLLRIARHEAGHTFVAWKSGMPIHQVTIVGRGGAGGYMEHKHDDDRDLQTKEDFLTEIRVKMAGRAAELIYYGANAGLSVGVGAPKTVGGSGGDLPDATRKAIQLVRVYGMHEEIGQLAVDELAVEYSQRPLAEKSLLLAEKIISEQLGTAKALIEANRDLFDHFVDELLRYNRPNENQLACILGT